VNSVDVGSSKENITVMFSSSANGKTCCPMTVYPYKRIPEKISQSLPAEWVIARSDRGCMTSEVFYEYTAYVFHPFLDSQGIIFPVVLFVDSHKSHLTYQLSVLRGEILNKVIFAPLLREVIDSAAKPETRVKGFHACELCPLNANAVDYTKCLGKNATARPRRTNEKNGRQDPSTTKPNQNASMD
jgi:hypothetical protein